MTADSRPLGQEGYKTHHWSAEEIAVGARTSSAFGSSAVIPRAWKTAITFGFVCKTGAFPHSYVPFVTIPPCAAEHTVASAALESAARKSTVGIKLEYIVKTLKGDLEACW
jgi:hypothetical protein